MVDECGGLAAFGLHLPDLVPMPVPAFDRFEARLPPAASRRRFRTRRFVLAAGIAALGGVLGQAAGARDFTAGPLVVEQPWSRATPGGAKVAIGYLVIRNNGDVPDRLTAATTEVSEKVSQHTMTMKDGVMIMRLAAGGVLVPAHGTVAFEPGSDHLMLEGLKRPLKQGESFSGTLTFANAGTLPVSFEVESIGARGPAGHGKPTNMPKN